MLILSNVVGDEYMAIIVFSFLQSGNSYQNHSQSQPLSIYLYLSRSHVDRWGATDALTTISLHSSRFSVILSVSLSFSLVIWYDK